MSFNVNFAFGHSDTLSQTIFPASIPSPPPDLKVIQIYKAFKILTDGGLSVDVEDGDDDVIVRSVIDVERSVAMASKTTKTTQTTLSTILQVERIQVRTTPSFFSHNRASGLNFSRRMTTNNGPKNSTLPENSTEKN